MFSALQMTIPLNMKHLCKGVAETISVDQVGIHVFIYANYCYPFEVHFLENQQTMGSKYARTIDVTH